MPRFAIAALAVVLAACQSPQTHVERLRYYDECSRFEVAPVTHVATAAELPTDIPAIVPYAMLKSVGTEGALEIRERICRRINQVANPDLIVFHDEGTVNLGAVQTHWGMGIWTSENVYGNQVSAWAYRLGRVRLGVYFDANRMVTRLDDHARASGLLEGDTLVSVGGKEVLAGEKWHASPHLELLINGQPGTKVKAVWIRAGVGRMEGEFELVENQREVLDGLPVAPELPQIEA